MAAEDQESGRGFRVQDRRRFSPETGEPRSVEETAETAAQEEPASPSSSQVKATKFTAPQAPESISFSSFILGLSTQALMFMGEIPLAPDQPPQTDLVAAQQMIDVLAMLQQKTQGNRDTAEDAMLENALFDLRMRYVALVKNTRKADGETETP
jgi:hypothetical protein